MEKKRLVLWFNEISIGDTPIVGGKNSSLGEMYTKLTKKGINVPNGFCTTSEAYDFFIGYDGLENTIKDLIKKMNIHDIRSLKKTGKAIRRLITKAKFPEQIKKEIVANYKKLSKYYKLYNCDVAVRSSATAEDLPTASFAGQQETFLNIRGEKALLKACKKCFASLFTDRAISYREDKHFNHFKVKLSIGVQKMIRSDRASSGVMFSLDTETGFQNVVFVTSIYGLGENIVQGTVNPDEFYVFKPTIDKAQNPIIKKSLGAKQKKMIYLGSSTTNIKTTKKERKSYSITDKETIALAKHAITIEKHYKKPMDIEWAKDGSDNKLYIVQARPETIHSQKKYDYIEEYALKKKGKVLVTGKSVGAKVGTGKVNKILSPKKIHEFKKGQILVTDMTDPDWEPIMKIASAIVTNKGGRTCHAAIISRELGIPCIVGTKNATRILKNNQPITVSCTEGEVGYVYEEILPFKIEKTRIKNIPKTKTKIMMNLGSPEQAFESSFLPNDGVGLAREEFIINNHIKIHPLALINYEKLDRELKEEIHNLTKNYKDKKRFFVDKLTEGIALLAAAFYPNDVILRFSDFKSNEYANLIGGKGFEPEESNPMIGWRGASRYYDKQYMNAFGLECVAIKRVREKMGLTNLKVMVPFCRTIEEGKKVLETMKKFGLKRGKNKLEVYVMAEIPSNIILAKEFCKIFDGFSIGSNDLTQLILGTDRDSELISHIYDERNPAVKTMIKQLIKTAKKYKKKVGICGQAPSDYPEFAKFLVEAGIDSISLNPDTIVKTRIKIAQFEKNRS